MKKVFCKNYVRKRWKTIQKCRKSQNFSKTSKRFRLCPNSSPWVRMGQNTSESLEKLTKASKNLPKTSKTSRKFPDLFFSRCSVQYLSPCAKSPFKIKSFLDFWLWPLAQPQAQPHLHSQPQQQPQPCILSCTYNMGGEAPPITRCTWYDPTLYESEPQNLWKSIVFLNCTGFQIFLDPGIPKFLNSLNFLNL